MKISINGKEIPLTKTNSRIADESVTSFIEVVRRSAADAGNEALYLTTLIAMYVKSSELLNELGADNIKYILEHFAEQVEK